MANNEGSSADLPLQLDFCVKKWNFCQYYEEDKIVTKLYYSENFCSTHLHYDDVFFRVQDVYNAMSEALDRLGVDPNDQVECINSTITKAQQLCLNNMSKADHREHCVLSTLVISYEDLSDERQEPMEDEDEGMVTEDEDEGMVPAALPAIRSLGASRIEVKDSKNVQQCMVCQEEYRDGEKVTCMPCSHMFHSDCITKWLVRSHLCPICRFEMPKYS